MAGKVIPFHAFRQMASALVKRAQLASQAGKTYEGDRDLYKWLGYKKNLNFTDFNDRYLRGGVAGRIVDAFPQATWRVHPIITGLDGFDELEKRINLFQIMERVDKLAGIGWYAAAFIGFRGGRPLDRPPANAKGPQDILFITPLSQTNAEIAEIDDDPSSERFGLPTIYNVTFSRSQDGSAVSIPGLRNITTRVHYSRIIHVAEGLLEDSLFGMPRLMRPWNYLDDLDKIVGGGAEAIWRTVDRGLHIDIDKDAILDPDDEDDFDDEIQEYMHQFKRFIKTQGVTIKPLGAEAPDTSNPTNSAISLISGTTGIPQRILMGSERGQLASSQDERNFNARVKERQISYGEGVILRPFINRAIEFGALSGNYTIKWPDISMQTDRERADVAARMAQAIKNVSTQASEMVVMSPEDFKSRFIDEGKE